MRTQLLPFSVSSLLLLFQMTLKNSINFVARMQLRKHIFELDWLDEEESVRYNYTINWPKPMHITEVMKHMISIS